MSKDNKCLDEDECKSRKARSGKRCRNTIGSFHCVPCPRGYTEGKNGQCLAPGQFQCVCGENEECLNDECVCQEGYEMDEYGDCVWPDDDKITSDASRLNKAFF
ncbi:thrombospondin-4-like [Oculina patagonica]